MTKVDVEQAMDYVLTLLQSAAAKTKWTFDDRVASWLIAGKAGLVIMVCRALGIPTATGEPVKKFAVAMTAPEKITPETVGTDDQASFNALSPTIKQAVQFILEYLRKWFGAWVPVTPPSE